MCRIPKYREGAQFRRATVAARQGHDRPTMAATPMTASPQLADITGESRDFRFGPGTDVHFASLGRTFYADVRGFSPIDGGLEGGGSVS
jgi:hypothetical protein